MIKNNSLPIHIVPIGGIFVTDKPIKIQTVLGSCISVTLFDTKRIVSGMNHILLPGNFDTYDTDNILEQKDTRYGIFSLEKLLSEMQNLNCLKKDLQARIFGASYLGVNNSIFNIQKSNVDFVKTFLKMVQIPIVEEITLQQEALKIILNSTNGKVDVVKLSSKIKKD